MFNATSTIITTNNNNNNKFSSERWALRNWFKSELEIEVRIEIIMKPILKLFLILRGMLKLKWMPVTWTQQKNKHKTSSSFYDQVSFFLTLDKTWSLKKGFFNQEILKLYF